jgi:hypothetical protein
MSDNHRPQKEAVKEALDRRRKLVVNWKRIGATEYVAKWQGINLSLQYLTGGKPEWRLFADGQKVREVWTSVKSAMDAIEAGVERELKKLSAAAVAIQRPLSTERIHRHG